jgi:hypothetical protein
MQKQTPSEEKRIYFRAESHRERFLRAIESTPRMVYDGDKLDQEYSAAFYILCAHAETWEKAESFITPNGIHFADLLQQTHFSTGDRALVELAGNLFGQDIRSNPVDLMVLDPKNFSVALQALHMRKYPIRLSQI